MRKYRIARTIGRRSDVGRPITRIARTVLLVVGLAIATVTGASVARADEGLWLLNRPPRRQLRQRYGFDPTPQWLEHVQKSCVRFNDGGSGSFVAADGLIMANQHVGADVLPKLGDAHHNYYRDGFYAETRDQELRCDGLAIDVLMSIDDVTSRVNESVRPGMTAEEAVAARQAVTAEIEKESGQKTGLSCEVVSLDQGIEHHLYRYRRYTDVRVVFAPEQEIAFFGGDPDNFEFPRYDFDVYFFRAYEAGRPAHIDRYLKWSRSGVTANELVMVAGNPRHSERLATVAALAYQRDTGFPELLKQLYRLEVPLSAWSGRSDENARKAKELLFRIADTRKARDGGLAGLLDPALIAGKQAEEDRLRAAVERDPALREAAGAWTLIAEAQRVRRSVLRRYGALEQGGGFNSLLFNIARVLVRAADERERPDRLRLTEYTDARLPSLEPVLFSTQPIDKEYETFKLAGSLTCLPDDLRDDPEFVRRVLAGKSPKDRAFALVHGTHLDDLKVRKTLYEKGAPAVAASRDPLIELARLVDPPSRAVRRRMETEVDEVERKAYVPIARARHALGGPESYPDATSTLRLSFGTLRGYEDQGKKIPFQTTFAGLYDRSREHGNQQPFHLPRRWRERQNRLRPDTPFNFVCTADAVGGISGSPVVNRKGEVVGLIFDRNLQSLVLDFAYTDTQARALGVHSPAIIEGLRKVYGAGALVDEIVGH